MRMDKQQSNVTERIISFTLEIIYLLTGEGYKVVRKTPSEKLTSSNCLNEPSAPPFLTPETIKKKKILDIINKIIELLTGEVPIRCQDVTVYLSMEEWEYLEGHKDLYKDVMMEEEPDGSSKRNPPQKCPCPLEDLPIPQQDQGKDLINMKVRIKEEEDEERVRGDLQSAEEFRIMVAVKEEESSLDIGTAGGHLVITPKMQHILSAGYNPEDTDVAEYSAEGNPKAHSRLHKARCVDRSMDPSHPQDSFQKSHTVTNDILPRLYVAERPLAPSNTQRSPSTNLITTSSRKEGNGILRSKVNEGFRSRTAEDQRTNTGQRPYQCSECGKSFNWKGHLLRHLRSHTDERPFSCLQCEKCFKHRADLSRHQRCHTGERPYSCSECEKCFSRKDDLLTHQKSHTGGQKISERPQIVPVKCKSEDNDVAEYSAEANPDRHHRTQCANRSMEPSIPKESTHKSQTVSKEIHPRLHVAERSLAPSNPQKSPTSNLNTSSHKDDNVVLRSKVNESVKSDSSITEDQKTNTGERTYPCSECGKSFNWKGHLLRHLKSHTDERPFACFQCEKCFKHRADLLRHQRCHTGERPYSCSECEKCFTRKDDLLKHQKSHTGECSFSCLECGKCFTWKRALRIHQRSHTGERPYLCLDCGKCFTQKGNLRTHQKLHTGERPFSCQDCGKCFTMRSRLITHQKTHSR